MKKYFFCFYILIAGYIYPQSAFEPVFPGDIFNPPGSPSSSSVYIFLNRLSVKGIIEYNDEMLPLSRIFIAEKLLEAESKQQQLSELERNELTYFMQEFYPEIKILNNDISERTIFFNEDDRAGFRPFLYMDENFTISADLILGLMRDLNRRYNHRWNGMKMHGYYDKVGFSFYFRDNEESGSNIDFQKTFTREPGIALLKTTETSMEYSEVRGMISYSWNWGSFDFGKDYLQWGSGRGGQLIFSNKAPSYPFIRLILKPVDWLHFQYVHGFLHSGVLDSSTIRQTPLEDRQSFEDVDKFIVAHMISLYPFDDLSFSLGESVVYSNKIEPLYLLPVIFLRPSDHYLSDRFSNTGSNAQVFMNAVYKNNFLRSKVYGTLFIDELSIADIFKGGNLAAAGYTLGLNFVDPVIKNSEFVIEYTKVTPFVYMNWNDAEVYTNHRYQLGHWIGSNAEHYYASYTQWIMRGFNIRISGDYVRKGQTEIPEQQYQLPYPSTLHGARLNYKSVSVEANYEFFRNLAAKLFYLYTDISDQETGRVPSFRIGKNHSLGFSFRYGW